MVFSSAPSSLSLGVAPSPDYLPHADSKGPQEDSRQVVVNIIIESGMTIINRFDHFNDISSGCLGNG